MAAEGSVGVDDYIMMRVRQHGRLDTVTFIDEPPAEALFCPIISVDDHALEPPSLFEGRLPAKLQDRAPKVVQGDDGAPWWEVEGTLLPVLMLNGASGRPMNEWGMMASGYEEMRRGVWDSKARVADMDMTGVWASLCFGSTIWGFAGTRFSTMSDPEVGLACLKAYNDWMIDEWCGAAPERYIPCQLPWLQDAEVAAAEIYRNAERGFRAVSFSENPEGLGFPNIYQESWDPFFRACEETQTVINLHVGSSGSTHRPSTSSAEGVATTLFPLNGIAALVDWVFAGIPERYPTITIALSEAGMSWVPMAYERLRRAHRQSVAVGKGWPYATSPEDLARRNFVYTSIEDPSGFQMLDLIGADRVMVETDYPHYDSTWPESQKMIREELAGLEPAVIRQVCYENASRTYRHPLPPAEMIAASEIGSA
ncbi:MAG: putative TIM-barrel fold metal-dependent hydrolase [Actinomycetia bacterium]|nr:putative TIM-barrel fold metal-dependent hydrolase [Actinomycetes bacterium]